jgi:uncharacterized protein YcfJ
MASNPDNCNVERVKTAGSGALVGGTIGGFIGGPPGAAAGAAIGAFIGDRVAVNSGHCKPTSCPCEKKG